MRVGDQLFVREQTADRTDEEGKWKERGLALTAWMNLVMWRSREGGMQGSDVDVREWCGRDIFQHTSSSLPLIGVPPRWE